MVVWIIGLSASGKTTLAREVVRLVRQTRQNIVLLDGDVIRETFGNDLGHSMEDRRKNAERLCRLGSFLENEGIDVVCAILSIFPETRAWNRQNLAQYYEVFIDVPMPLLMERETKGHYARFVKGETSDVVGMDIEFPVPECPDLVIRNTGSKDQFMTYASQIANRLNGSE